jgi:hypothetical protein
VRVRERVAPLPLLAAAAAAAGLVCLAAPLLVWLGGTPGSVECGWTCYVPLGGSGHGGLPHWVTVSGRTGFGVSPGLGAVLVLVGIGALVAALLLARRRTIPAPLGWALAALATVSLAWSLVVVATRTAGDRIVLARHGGASDPTTGLGAWTALGGAALAICVFVALVRPSRRGTVHNAARQGHD